MNRAGTELRILHRFQHSPLAAVDPALADDAIDRVKEASDIVEVIGEYLPLTRKGRVFKALCPFHDDHHPSFDVDPQRQSFTCWACGKRGDVFTFVMEKERVGFGEALELLAKRAHLELKPGQKAAGEGKARLLDVMKWAAERYHQRLLAPESGHALAYLRERRLSDDVIAEYQLGYAPAGWDWLAQEAEKAKIKRAELEKLGLCAPRKGDGSLYDLFRDRIIFPIRDGRGRTIAFGGRILPGSAQAADAPKYYNSRESPLFVKSQHFYGLDRARPAAEKEGFLAIVEGYTDVLMAHQLGVLPVVATLGTALNGHHLENLGKLVRRVVLVYDADAGGRSGIDRALQLFIQNEIDLAIAVLPEGQDPFDYLLAAGAEPFRARLLEAKDALEFVLERAVTPSRLASVAGRQDALEEVLRLLALIPHGARTSLEVRKQLALSRLAQQFALEERTLWQRLGELQRGGRRAEAKLEAAPSPAPADPLEKELLAVALLDSESWALLRNQVSHDEIQHPGIRSVLELMEEMAAANEEVTFDLVRLRLADRPKLVAALSSLHAESLAMGNVAARCQDVLKGFRHRRRTAQLRELRSRIRQLQPDHPEWAKLNHELHRLIGAE